MAIAYDPTTCCLIVGNAFLIQGMSMPIAHVEESWQMAEFYNNKVLLYLLEASNSNSETAIHYA